jgi:hypothetical protein
MTDIIKYIGEILLRSQAIYIPSIGLLSLRIQPAHFIANAGKFEPAKAVVELNNTHITDDTVLRNYIVTIEHCSIATADIKIQQFVHHIRQDLNANRECVLHGLGIFTIDENSNIRFDLVSDSIINKTNWGLEPITSLSIDPSFNNLATEKGLGEDSVNNGFKIGIVIFFSLSIIIIMALAGLLCYQYYLDYKETKAATTIIIVEAVEEE